MAPSLLTESFLSNALVDSKIIFSNFQIVEHTLTDRVPQELGSHAIHTQVVTDNLYDEVK